MPSRLHKLRRIVPFKGLLRPPLRFLKRMVYRRRLAAYRRTLASRGNAPRVLVVMTGGIGNAVEATPLVQAIRMLWPGAELSLYKPPGDLLADWCIVDHCYLNMEELDGKSFDHTFLPFAALRLPPDAGCDLGEMHEILTVSSPLFQPERDYDLDLVKRYGYSGVVPPLYVSIREPDLPIPPGGTRVCLCPGSKPLPRWRHKLWPYYADLANMLLAEYDDVRIRILGTKDDVMALDPDWGDRILDLRGKLTLSEAAWVLKHSDIAIGNDCGPMHIADAVSAPSLVLFGPTCEIKNGPRNKGSVLFAEAPCRPCQYDEGILTCRTPRCMLELTPEYVSEEIRKMLQATHGRAGRGAEEP